MGYGVGKVYEPLTTHTTTSHFGNNIGSSSPVCCCTEWRIFSTSILTPTAEGKRLIVFIVYRGYFWFFFNFVLLKPQNPALWYIVSEASIEGLIQIFLGVLNCLKTVRWINKDFLRVFQGNGIEKMEDNLTSVDHNHKHVQWNQKYRNQYEGWSVVYLKGAQTSPRNDSCWISKYCNNPLVIKYRHLHASVYACFPQQPDDTTGRINFLRKNPILFWTIYQSASAAWLSIQML